ncbi:MAG: hypothetical protein JWN30_416 [Bacilli bacterium]|nr:hypothetical protein [Bacilli bacterium]
MPAQNSNESIEHGINAAKSHAASEEEQQKAEELANQLGNATQSGTSTTSANLADGVRFDYDDNANV